MSANIPRKIEAYADLENRPHATYAEARVANVRLLLAQEGMALSLASTKDIVETVDSIPQQTENQPAAADNRLPEAKRIISGLLGEIVVPDANCSCHISAPCGDCERWADTREAVAEAEAFIAES